MLFWVLARKAYLQNLQYRGAHTMKTIASAIIGYIYASIWIGIGDSNSLGAYGTAGIVSYIAFNQAALWVVNGMSGGLGLEQSVRTGQLAVELTRPVHLYVSLMCREWGMIAYQFLYKTIPILVIYFFTVSLRLPESASTYLWTAVALALAAYVMIAINYLIGLAAVWTTESRWLGWLNFAVFTLLSGFFIPLEWLPGWLRALTYLTPYPYVQYHPTRIFLEREQLSSLPAAFLWCAALTCVCLAATAAVRRKIEIQGG
ncbi:ABC transporter permease [Paenibacillus sp. MBLB4367]|uniref:ABC transporter permease n=1 Tax=Paenibacillus sp. MBLB4367 TaxID=3384767 RepID=UPI0039080EC4